MDNIYEKENLGAQALAEAESLRIELIATRTGLTQNINHSLLEINSEIETANEKIETADNEVKQLKAEVAANAEVCVQLSAAVDALANVPQGTVLSPQQIADIASVPNKANTNLSNVDFTQSFPMLSGQSGWCKFPNGLIIQWGTLVPNGWTTVNLNANALFTSARTYRVLGNPWLTTQGTTNPGSDVTNAIHSVKSRNFSGASFRIAVAWSVNNSGVTSGDNTCDWIAIGY